MLFGAFALTNAQQITVSLPDIEVNPGETVQIPITIVTSVTSTDSCLGYQTLIIWDPAIGDVDSVLRGPLIPASWIPTWNVGVAGQANGGWWFYMAPYLTGAGEAGYLRFNTDANASPGATCELHFNSFLFTLAPSLTAVFDHGSITVAGAMPPDPVEDLVASVVANTDIYLIWSISANATEYDIYRGAEPYFDYTAATVYATVSEPGYTDSGAVAGGPYFYIVVATN